mmetsp:Transcript_1903/g.3922  ORF Transcript_1903/g.3922 Transcript_1903/m.3922 type:complete len:80 (+) Transcript_1903:148-387(+)
MKTLSQSGLEEWQEIDDALFSIDTLLDIFDKARKHSVRTSRHLIPSFSILVSCIVFTLHTRVLTDTIVFLLRSSRFFSL